MRFVLRRRGADLRPHVYEMFMVASFLAAHLFFRAHGFDVIVTYAPLNVMIIARALALTLVVGVAARTLGGVISGGAGDYLRQVLRWTWWVESLRLLFFGAVATHLYSSLKVLMPRMTSRNADGLLWEIDRVLLFGHSPNVLLMELFREPGVLRAVDWTYHWVFAATLWVVFALALSSPSQRVRVAFVGAKAMMWVAGAWLYYTLPSLGPAYRFSTVWIGAHQYMPYTVATLRALMDNYLVVVGAKPGDVNFLYGIGAFPSLHVAFQVFVAIWVRRFTRAGGALAWALAVLIFVGSLVTGWHYLADSVAGVVMAVVAYLAIVRVYRLDRWLRLFRLFRRPRPRFDKLLTA